MATKVDNYIKTTIDQTGPGEAHFRQDVALRLRVKRARLRDGSHLAEVIRLLTCYVPEKISFITDLLDEDSPLTSALAIIIGDGMIVETTSGTSILTRVTMVDQTRLLDLETGAEDIMTGTGRTTIVLTGTTVEVAAEAEVDIVIVVDRLSLEAPRVGMSLWRACHRI